MWEVAVAPGLGMSNCCLEGKQDCDLRSGLPWGCLIASDDEAGLAHWDSPDLRQIYLHPSGEFSLHTALQSTFSKSVVSHHLRVLIPSFSFLLKSHPSTPCHSQLLFHLFHLRSSTIFSGMHPHHFLSQRDPICTPGDPYNLLLQQ